MKVLGLDTSTTSTGYAVWENNRVLCCGIIKPSKKHDTLDRILHIEKEIKEIISKKEVEMIIIEDLAVTRNASSTRVLAGLLYHLLLEFRKRELLTILVKPTEWRKFVGIKGKREECKKQAVVLVESKYGLVVDDDESEAILIAEYVNNLKFE